MVRCSWFLCTGCRVQRLTIFSQSQNEASCSGFIATAASAYTGESAAFAFSSVAVAVVALVSICGLFVWCRRCRACSNAPFWPPLHAWGILTTHFKYRCEPDFLFRVFSSPFFCFLCRQPLVLRSLQLVGGAQLRCKWYALQYRASRQFWFFPFPSDRDQGCADVSLSRAARAASCAVLFQGNLLGIHRYPAVYCDPSNRCRCCAFAGGAWSDWLLQCFRAVS